MLKYPRYKCPICEDHWLIFITIGNFPKTPALVCSSCGEIITNIDMIKKTTNQYEDI